MKNVISIFCLPNEIDNLENTIVQLSKSYDYMEDPDNWFIDVTMGVSDYIVDWSNSKLQSDFFVNRLNEIEKKCIFKNKLFRVSHEIQGCVSQRRFTLDEYNDADYFVWLDTDIIFVPETLAWLETSINHTNETYPYSIITPEIVRIWDNTWDCLVNENFKDKPLNYQKTNDPYIDSGVKGNVSIVTVTNDIHSHPRFKFAGGWFTCISGHLLRRIGVPDPLGHYGLEDTFIMHASEKLCRLDRLKIYQFKIKNLVICENYLYRDKFYTKDVTIIDRREEFKRIAQNGFKLSYDKVN